jgi:hypothetical protein
MIRIEGIPVVATKLAADLTSTKAVKNPTRFRRQRMQPSVSPSPSTTVLARRPRANAQERA